jgi:hypothetical protein
MFAMQYSHRLPAGHDMEAIRRRAAQRGPLWDHTEGLVFKAFVAQERGRHRAVGHLYASVYLWREPAAAASFLMGERFQNVIDSFGRPRVESWLPLDARAGAARTERAAWLRRSERALDADADRAAVFAAQSREPEAGVVATWSALDLAAWRIVRFTLLTDAPDAPDAGDGDAIYEVLHLAKPGLETLQ